MQRSSERILTTHTGSLPRPPELLELIRAREQDRPYDRAAFDKELSADVAAVVQQQVAAGVDIVSDGEFGKPSFFGYVRNRLQGLEVDPNNQPRMSLSRDFPGFDEWRARQTPPGSLIAQNRPSCVGPLAWKDRAAVDADIANFKRALQDAQVTEAFIPCASVGIIAQRIPNRYYPSYEAYVEAIAGVMCDEYHAVADAGLLVQIDAPEMGIDRNQPEFRDRPLADFRKRMELWVEALNTALAGIPEEQVRFHVCWGNNEGPHTQDVPLKDILDVVLKVHAQAYSIEASNPRHEHEWKIWKETKLPEGKILIPGVIDSTTNFVEHPELVADRILNFAGVVGRENVIAGTDCGFGTAADSATVYPPIVWAKLKAMAEGAELASRQLWG